MFAGWLHTLNVLRNLAAHHSRVWNSRISIPPGLPKRGKIPEFDHMLDRRLEIAPKVYASLVIMSYLMSRIGTESTRVRDARALFDDFPSVPGHSLDMMGFPSSWQSEAVWDWS